MPVPVEVHVFKYIWKEIRTIWDLWDNIKCTNTLIIWVPEGEEKEKGPENIFEDIIAEKFPNLWKETVTQVQEAQSPIQN